MTIVQLEYLLAVVNFGSFSLAAERSFVTQPSLSMQIKNLEEELGVVLLDRSKKPVILTQAGEVVAERARDVVKMFNSVYEDVAVLKGTVSGVLRLGVIPTVAPLSAAADGTGFCRTLSRRTPRNQGDDNSADSPGDGTRRNRRRHSCGRYLSGGYYRGLHLR